MAVIVSFGGISNGAQPMRVLMMIGALCALLALPARAEIAGQADPAFQAALKDWLSADEARALPALADLAAADNRAAQVLLGVIDVTPQYQGRWLYALPRGERMALMRAPSGGISGGNWLRVAAVDVPVAAAWVALWDGNAGPMVMLDFARLGEDAAARLAAKRLARRAAKGFAPLAEHPDFPAFARALAIREWQGTEPEKAQAALAALPAADPGRALLGSYRPDPAALMALADTDPALALLGGLLDALCPDPAARTARLASAFDMLGGWWGLADLGPPAEVLIGPDAWIASAQGQAALVRLLPAPAPEGAAGLDPCLADLMQRGAAERASLP